MEEIEKKIINELPSKKKWSRDKFAGNIGALCYIKLSKWIHYDVAFPIERVYFTFLSLMSLYEYNQWHKIIFHPPHFKNRCSHFYCQNRFKRRRYGTGKLGREGKGCLVTAGRRSTCSLNTLGRSCRCWDPKSNVLGGDPGENPVSDFICPGAPQHPGHRWVMPLSVSYSCVCKTQGTGFRIYWKPRATPVAQSACPSAQPRAPGEPSSEMSRGSFTQLWQKL